MRVRSVASLATGALLLVASEGGAHAIGLPDIHSQCNNPANGVGCFRITNTNTTGAPFASTRAIVGVGFNSGAIGVEGEANSSLGIGVRGRSTSGFAVMGESSAGGVGVRASSVSGIGLIAQSQSNVGISTSSNNNDGIVAATFNAARSGIFAQNLTSGGGGFGIYASATGTGQAVHGENANADGWAGFFNGKIFAAGGLTSSDARLKKNIADLSYGLKEVNALRPVTFKWKDQVRGDARHVGLIAQEIQKVVPELVDKDASSGTLAVDYAALGPILIKAVQEQQKIIERQEARIARLEKGPVMSSMLSGGIDSMIVVGLLGAVGAFAFRRKRAQ